ncbi:hypothetical protein ACWDRB_61815 [Nonomuraea sp. NPDC003707]
MLQTVEERLDARVENVPEHASVGINHAQLVFEVVDPLTHVRGERVGIGSRQIFMGRPNPEALPHLDKHLKGLLARLSESSVNVVTDG